MSSSPVEFSIAAPVRDPYKDRRPPYSEDAEQAVLSAMLMDPDAILRATEFLDDTMFYREGHRRIFRAMLGLSERGDVVDPLTLSEELARSGSLESLTPATKDSSSPIRASVSPTSGIWSAPSSSTYRACGIRCAM